MTRLDRNVHKRSWAEETSDNESLDDESVQSVAEGQKQYTDIARGEDMPCWFDSDLNVESDTGERRAVPVTVWDTFHNARHGLRDVYDDDEIANIVGKDLSRAAAMRGSER